MLIPCNGIFRCTFYESLRDDLPDVDIDFEHHKQAEVMERILKNGPARQQEFPTM